jgi:arabinogalactan oligomer/maltooligosaccharide transport system permease protein
VSAAGQPLAHAGAAPKETRTVFLQRSLWAVVLLGLATAALLHAGLRGRTWKALREHADAYAYVAPAMIGMLVLVFFPFFYGIGLAFTDTTLFNESRAVPRALDRARQLHRDPGRLQHRHEERRRHRRQLPELLLDADDDGDLDRHQRHRRRELRLHPGAGAEYRRPARQGLYRVLLILPWAIPNYITALVWRGMFHPQFGVINQMLQMFGMEPVRWFDSVVSAFMTGLVTNGWLSFPFMMVVILGALQSIPRDMYEAAEVDGRHEAGSSSTHHAAAAAAHAGASGHPVGGVDLQHVQHHLPGQRRRARAAPTRS